MKRMALALLPLTAAWGCGDGDDAPQPAAPAACAAGETLADDGSCIPAGLPPDLPCPPGEWLDRGSCVAAGVPPDGCGAGFEHEGVGCEPVLPAAPCPPGEIAAPGSTQCHEIAPCGSGTWGDIATDDNSEHVDASYTGGNSDGSASAPWTTIGEAITAAPYGGTVAVAAGSYAEDLYIYDKPVTVWGRCPAMVELVGTGMFTAAIEVQDGSMGTVIRGLSITGDVAGFILSGSRDLVLEQLWIHDTSDRGVNVQATLGPTSVILRDSLVETTSEYGVYVSGASATIEGSVIRDTRFDGQGGGGRGISAQSADGQPASVTLRGSLLSSNRALGLYVSGSEAIVDGSVIRDTQLAADGNGGRAVSVQMSDDPLAGNLVLTGSVLERNHELGVHVAGSNATIETTVIRGTRPNRENKRGSGASVVPDPSTGTAGSLAIRTSLIDDNTEIGVGAGSSQLSLAATVVRNTMPDYVGRWGRGVEAHLTEEVLAPSTLTIETSLIEGNSDMGVYVAGSALTLDSSVVRGTHARADGVFGRGVNVQASPVNGAPSGATLSNVLIDANHEAGLYVADSPLAIDHSRITATLVAEESDRFGDGLLIASSFAQAHVTVVATRIEDSKRAGLASYGATVVVTDSQMLCQTFDVLANDYNGFVVTVEDAGNNACGCPEPTEACQRAGSSEPPPPIGGLE